MKLVNTLSTVALVTILGSTLVAPAANAATSVDGKGHIHFTDSEEVIPVTPPGETGPEITDPEANPDPAKLKIVAVSDLEFDTHGISTAESVKKYKALPFTTTEKVSGKEITMPNFVRFQDTRTDGLENFYKISAQITSQFANNGKALTGATLDYGNVSLVTGTNPTTKPVAAHQNSFTITADDKTPIVDQKEVGKGFGVFDLMFGKDNTEAAESIVLEVPSGVVFATGDYNAEITWSVEDAR